MGVRFTCPNGHQWQSGDEGAQGTCPVCQAQGHTVPEPATTVARPLMPPPPGDDTPVSGWTATEERAAAASDRDWPALEGYACLGRLGEGGMGVVFKARQTSLRRLVAIKTLKAGFHASRKALARFRIEAEAVAALQHPHIVNIYEVGQQNGRPYFSMEYVDGGSLAQRIEAAGRLDLHEAARLVEKIAGAMQHAHERGILHRDLKPGNVLLVAAHSASLEESGWIRTRGASGAAAVSATGGNSLSPHETGPRSGSGEPLPFEPKIADFGLAKRVEEEMAMTMPEERLGTPAYMAPEQLSGRHSQVGPATDVYALGAILHECVTGRRPQRNETTLETTTPTHYRPLPRDLETIILKCLRCEPADRYATAGELAEDLRRYQAGEPILGRRIGMARRGMLWVRRKPIRAAVALLAVVAVAAGLMWTRHQYLYVWESVSYYKQFVKQFGMPYGIGQITAGDASHRWYTYRFVRAGRQGRVKSIDVVNGRDRPTWNNESMIYLEGIRENLPQNARECRFVFDYDESGNVIQEAGYNVAGERIWRLNYFYSDTPGEDGRRRVKARFHNADGDLVTAPSGANTTLFLRDDEGFDERVVFLDSNGDQPRCDVMGNFGYQFKYDDRRRITHIANLDPEGRPAPNINGIISLDLTYDAAGHVTEMKYTYGEPSLPVPLQMRRQTFTCDEFGNVVEQRSLNDAGELVDSDAGFAVHKTQFDRWGNQIRIELFNDREVQISHAAAEFDDDGYPTRQLLHTGDDETPVVQHFDRRGNNVREEYLSPDGEVVAVTTWEYNKLGRATEQFDWQADGKTLLGRSVSQYNYRGKLAEQLHYGPDGKTLLGKTVWQYGPHGNMTEERHLDPQDNPQRSDDGYTRLTRDYDEQGRLREETQWGLDRPDGVTRYVTRYDPLGREIEEAFFNDQEEPQRTEGGYLRATYVYSDTGRRVETTFWGFDGSYGFARSRQVVDVTTMRNTWTFFDDEDRQVRTAAGYLQQTQQYTPDVRLRSETFSGYDGSDGFTSYTMDYDENVQPRTWTGRGFDGSRGFTVMRRTVDQAGNFVSEAYFDDQLQPVMCTAGYARFACNYDEEGALTGVDFFDLADKPIDPRVVVVVTRLIPGSEDMRPGLQVGDRIVSYNGLPIPVAIALMNAQPLVSADTESVPLEIQRDGQRQILDVKPGRLGIMLEEQPAPSTTTPRNEAP